MPAEVCNLDETYAHRAASASFEHRVVFAGKHLRAGDCMRVYAPTIQEVAAIAAVFAEFREIYLGHEKAKAAATMYDAIKADLEEKWAIERDLLQKWAEEEKFSTGDGRRLEEQRREGNMKVTTIVRVEDEGGLFSETSNVNAGLSQDEAVELRGMLLDGLAKTYEQAAEVASAAKAAKAAKS